MGCNNLVRVTKYAGTPTVARTKLVCEATASPSQPGALTPALKIRHQRFIRAQDAYHIWG